MDKFRNNFSFYFKARFNEVEPGTDYLYQSNGIKYEFRIANDGFANEKLEVDNLGEIVRSNSGITLFDSKNRKNKLSFQNEEIYLLENYYQTYTSSCQLKIGGKFYVLVSKNARAEVAEWLKANEARKIEFTNDLNATYNLFFIKEVKSALTSIKILDCDDKIAA